MLDPVPWVVAGGKHSAAVARSVLYNATGGNEGITAPNDLQVRALPTPGGAVRIMPGGSTILNRYPGGDQQSYGARNITATDLDVPATGSAGGRVDYVVQRIDDPEFGGQTPADPTAGPYVRFELVSSVANLTYPAIVLARLDIPASTATVTQAMITDLRRMANPRSLEVLRAAPTVTGDSGLTLSATATTGEWFPNSGGNQLIEVPEWAVRAQIRAEWIGVVYSAPGDANTRYWVEFGPYSSPSRERATQKFATNATYETGGIFRNNWILANDVYVPPAYRGTTQGFTMYAQKVSGTADVAFDALGGVSLSVKFLEQPEPSTS